MTLASLFCKSKNKLTGAKTVSGKEPRGWTFSKTSKTRLKHKVDKRLQKVAVRALQYSDVNFGITSGYRTNAEQNGLFRKGASQLDGYKKRSKHQDGLAVDVHAVNDAGKAVWDTEYYCAIAAAFRKAAEELNVKIRWGGAWTVLNGTTELPQQLILNYKDRKRREGRKPFLDLVHFEAVA